MEAIAYYRVSTQKQGQSGLGLDAQRQAVETYAAKNDLDLAACYTEIETGTRKRNRVEITRAIEHAQRIGGRLLIAKLDRLARNVHFISSLHESGVDFVAVDMPQANRLTVNLLAAIAEHEAELISQRTREALKAAKARGVELGRVSNLDQEARERGAATMRTNAENDYRKVSRLVLQLRRDGRSYREIARTLNADGWLTRRRKAWSAGQVRRVQIMFEPTSGSA